jgi:hypothetical protein
MTYAWYPGACYDRDLTEEFMSKGWTYYKQKESAAVENEIDFADIMKGDQEAVYTTWHFHQTHCEYMWRKMQRALEAGGPIDGYIGTYKHTVHCAGILRVSNVAMHHIGTMVKIKYPTCI